MKEEETVEEDERETEVNFLTICHHEDKVKSKIHDVLSFCVIVIMIM